MSCVIGTRSENRRLGTPKTRKNAGRIATDQNCKKGALEISSALWFFLIAQTAMHVVKPARRLSHDGRPSGWGNTSDIEDAPADLRVVSLLPSATEIIGALGIRERLVGCTHECDACPDELGMQAALAAGVRRVTSSAIDPHVTTQRDIDAAVNEHAATSPSHPSSTISFILPTSSSTVQA